MEIGIGLDVISEETPTLPDAKRGDSVEGLIRETEEQLAADLIWWPCSFCGRHVLVAVGRGREKCACGAVRCHSRGQEGWRRDGKEWWFC